MLLLAAYTCSCLRRLQSRGVLFLCTQDYCLLLGTWLLAAYLVQYLEEIIGYLGLHLLSLAFHRRRIALNLEKLLTGPERINQEY